MTQAGAIFLVAGGALSALAAVAHLICIVWGAPAYRVMGAGSRMVRAVEAGKVMPALITLAIAGVLLVWALYALSGAGLGPRLPLTKSMLTLISAIYLVRALAFPLLRPAFPENSMTFWLVSSGVCLVLGLLYAAGAVLVWNRPY